MLREEHVFSADTALKAADTSWAIPGNRRIWLGVITCVKHVETSTAMHVHLTLRKTSAAYSGCLLRFLEDSRTSCHCLCGDCMHELQVCSPPRVTT